ncbi:hypothetical protein H0H92_009113, partial [Tricholoma furcatifolium]
WLYQLILSQDANFHLKNRLRSSDEKDPSLGPGFAYFVDSTEYLTHLSQYVNQDEGPLAVQGINVFAPTALATFKKENGRTDGEGVERNWAWLNGTAASTSQMGPGSRHDTLDDYMGFWNYKRTIDLGNTLMRNMIEAIPEAILHRQAFIAFTDGLRGEHLKDIQQWEKAVCDFEAGNTEIDPYLVKEDSVTINEIRRALAHEEHEQVEQGLLSTDATPSQLILLGLEIEETQCTLLSEAMKVHTSAQQATHQHKRTNLLRKILKFNGLLPSFFPGLPPTILDKTAPEKIQLRLPSRMTADDRKKCLLALPDVEERIRAAYASDALGELRRQLRIRTFARKFKDENASSQGSYTRMRALHEQIDSKIRAARDKYNQSRSALLSLRGPGSWEETFRVLQAEDIVGLNERTVTEEELSAHQRAEDSAKGDSDAVMRTVSTLRLQTGTS